MDKSDLAGDGWNEEDVTAVCVIEGRPHVQVVKFNRNQEGLGKNALGADYLWWWIDSTSGESFGMLVQAKRLKLAHRQWHVDIRHRDGAQLSDLLRTAERLQVPAVYSIYTGGLVYRASLPCLHQEPVEGMRKAAPVPPGTPASSGLSSGQECGRCRRMAISMVTAYQLTSVWRSATATADTVLTESVPLEDLVDPAVPSTPIWDVNGREITDPELAAFLHHPQDGAREIARRIFRLVAYRRAGDFSAATPEQLTVPGAPVFPNVPKDHGHFPGSYYRHVLQGLRTSPPAYVEELLHPPSLDEVRDIWTRPDDASGRMVPTASSPSPARRQPSALDGTSVTGVVLVTV
jgi:hypothetical protein